MNNPLNHPIVEQSFAIIDQEVGEHQLNSLEYAIARRVIHATADFDYLQLLSFSPGAIDSGIAAIRTCVPIVTDVTMVKQGIRSLVAKTFNNPVIAAIDLVSGNAAMPTAATQTQAAYSTSRHMSGKLSTRSAFGSEASCPKRDRQNATLLSNLPTIADSGKTRTETGMLKCYQQYPEAIYVIGNAPTALLALCEQISNANTAPKLVIGAPVGFVSVLESKQALAQLNVPQIIVEGRKGGSPAAASILNALLILASDQQN